MQEATHFLTELVHFGKSFFGIIVLFCVLQACAVLLLSLKSEDPKETARAVYHYMLIGIGIVLMSLAALPTGIAVISGTEVLPESYMSLLTVFAAGGLLALFADNKTHELDAEAAKVPAALLFYTVRLAGVLSLLFAIVHLSVTVTFGDMAVKGWWAAPVAMGLYGGLLYWLTGSQTQKKGGRKKKK